MATDKPRFSITVDDWMYKALEDFRHEAGLSSRSQAAVVMIEKGFESIGWGEGVETIAANADNIRDPERHDAIGRALKRVSAKYWGTNNDDRRSDR